MAFPSVLVVTCGECSLADVSFLWWWSRIGIMVSMLYNIFSYMIFNPHDTFKIMAASCHVNRISVFHGKMTLSPIIVSPATPQKPRSMLVLYDILPYKSYFIWHIYFMAEQRQIRYGWICNLKLIIFIFTSHLQLKQKWKAHLFPTVPKTHKKDVFKKLIFWLVLPEGTSDPAAPEQFSVNVFDKTIFMALSLY